jgi:hypothetical protein
VELGDLLIVGTHRSALDPERTLVVGNRGAGKTFWAHALTQPEIRELVAKELQQPALVNCDVEIGFNARDFSTEIAPSKEVIRRILKYGIEPEDIWRAVMARAAAKAIGKAVPKEFEEFLGWLQSDPIEFDNLMRDADAFMVGSGKRLLLVFDALDRLADEWSTTRSLTQALLRRALAARSYRAIRLKLFMRLDQFADEKLYQFPDASKIRNTRVDLEWKTQDLYRLLFQRLSRTPVSKDAFSQLAGSIFPVGLFPGENIPDGTYKQIVDLLAGEFMTSGDRKDPSKRGRVFTWLPEHLADARMQVSPRTFLTAWREASHFGTQPMGKAVDHLGLQEGVRKASEDRLSELKEDYPWIDAALEPLKGKLVPMERVELESIWKESNTAKRVIDQSNIAGRLAPVQLEEKNIPPETSLVKALDSIGVLETRSNGKINLPDIFRVEAGIKRRGGVRPPVRRNSDSTR